MANPTTPRKPMAPRDRQLWEECKAWLADRPPSDDVPPPRPTVADGATAHLSEGERATRLRDRALERQLNTGEFDS